MKKPHLPISPAPKKSPRYPRVGVVWGAFAAGTLSGLVVPNLAHADCALPEHTGAVDPGGKGVVKKKKKDKTFTMTVVVPVITHTGGVVAATRHVELPPPQPPQRLGGEPMQVTPPVPGGEPPVAPPQGGPSRVAPPPPPHPLGGKPMAPKPPEGAKKEKPKPPLDGDLAQVGGVRYIHPHGPDEPCLPADPAAGRLVVKFT